MCRCPLPPTPRARAGDTARRTLARALPITRAAPAAPAQIVAVQSLGDAVGMPLTQLNLVVSGQS